MDLGDYLYIILLAAGALASMFQKNKERKAKTPQPASSEEEYSAPKKEISLDTILKDLLIPSIPETQPQKPKPIVETQSVRQKAASLKMAKSKLSADYQFNDDYYTKPNQKNTSFNQPDLPLSHENKTSDKTSLIMNYNARDLFIIDAILNRPYR